MNHSEEELIKRGRAAKDVLQALSLEHVWDYISAISEKGLTTEKAIAEYAGQQVSSVHRQLSALMDVNIVNRELKRAAGNRPYYEYRVNSIGVSGVMANAIQIASYPQIKSTPEFVLSSLSSPNRNLTALALLVASGITDFIHIKNLLGIEHTASRRVILGNTLAAKFIEEITDSLHGAKLRITIYEIEWMINAAADVAMSMRVK